MTDYITILTSLPARLTACKTKLLDPAHNTSGLIYPCGVYQDIEDLEKELDILATPENITVEGINSIHRAVKMLELLLNNQ